MESLLSLWRMHWVPGTDGATNVGQASCLPVIRASCSELQGWMENKNKLALEKGREELAAGSRFNRQAGRLPYFSVHGVSANESPIAHRTSTICSLAFVAFPGHMARSRPRQLVIVLIYADCQNLFRDRLLDVPVGLDGNAAPASQRFV